MRTYYQILEIIFNLTFIKSLLCFFKFLMIIDMIFVLLNIQKNKHLEKKIKNKNYFSKKIENYKTPTKIKYSSGIKKAIKNNWQNNSSELKKLIF